MAPALHILPKSKYGPLDADRAITAAAKMAYGLLAPIPIIFGGKVIGVTGWDKATDRVWCGFTGFDDIIANITNATPKVFSTLICKDAVFAASAPTAGIWYDYWCQGGGEPDAGTFPGAASTAYVHATTDPGLPPVGPAVAGGETRHIVGLDVTSVVTASAVTLIVYDRVLVYNNCPIINGTTTMTNTVAATRYSGNGVQMMLTIQTALNNTANVTSYSYNDDLGSTNTITQTFALDTGVTAASTQAAQIIAGTPRGPWLPLAAGDLGAQRINSFTTSIGRTGAVCFVLAKPICTLTVPVNGQSLSRDYIRQQVNMQQIPDDAALSLLMNSQSGTNPTVKVNLTFAWG